MPATQTGVDYSQLTQLKRDLTPGQQNFVRGARAAVKSASFAVEKRIKIEMPVDTGRARASWGHWESSLLKVSNPDAKAGDAIWQVDDGGLSIKQGTNVDYVEDLNQGSSRQAPAGFLDRAAAMGQIQLEVKLGFLDPLSKEYAMRIFEET